MKLLSITGLLVVAGLAADGITQHVVLDDPGQPPCKKCSPHPGEGIDSNTMESPVALPPSGPVSVEPPLPTVSRPMPIDDLKRQAMVREIMEIRADLNHESVASILSGGNQPEPGEADFDRAFQDSIELLAGVAPVAVNAAGTPIGDSRDHLESGNKELSKIPSRFPSGQKSPGSAAIADLIGQLNDVQAIISQQEPDFSAPAREHQNQLLRQLQDLIEGRID